jgi:hypothetical protein
MSKRVFVSGDDSVIGRVFWDGWNGFYVLYYRQGHYEIACSQEAHAYYGDKFTRTDVY